MVCGVAVGVGGCLIGWMEDRVVVVCGWSLTNRSACVIYIVLLCVSVCAVCLCDCIVLCDG